MSHQTNIEYKEDILPRAKLLIIDDDHSQLKFYQANLSQRYRCEFAKSASQGLSLLANQYPLPDLIILDVEMPEIDGFEVCQTLKNDSKTRHIPIIFVSAASSIDQKTKGFHVGCVDYMTKPVLIPEMQARINAHISLGQQNKHLESLSFIDSLTGISNRRKYNELMLREWQRSCRYKQPITTMLLDLDNFKHYNKLYGEQQGDNCLVTLANELKTLIMRPTDIFARISGEEFVFLLTDCDQSGAQMMADKVLASVNTLKIEHEGANSKNMLTCSMGVAVYTPAPGDDPLYLFQAADEALFRAKQNGKNKWEMCNNLSDNGKARLQ